MKIQGTSVVIVAVILCIVLLGLGYVGFTQFFTRVENNALTIVTLELGKSDEGANFTVTVAIKNTGRNDIINAELNFIFIKDNDIVDSKKQSVHLQTNVEDTYHGLFSDVSFEPNSTYKAIATIYLDNMLLDTKTITKQF